VDNSKIVEEEKNVKKDITKRISIIFVLVFMMLAILSILAVFWLRTGWLKLFIIILNFEFLKIIRSSK
jgi:hypothetical protein